MPPIAVHIDSPTIAAKAQGITPQTTEDASPTSTIDVATTTSSPPAPWEAEFGQAAAPSPPPSLPRMQTEPSRTPPLGENGLPRPQPSGGPRRRSYAPYVHTSTLPPPPQPGAVPRLTSQYSPPLPTSSLPPPPQPGAVPRRTSLYAPPTPTGSMPPSPQPGIVLPRRSSQYAPATGYSSLSPPPKAGELGRRDSQQPSGFTSALHQMHIPPPPPQVNWAPTYSTAIATGPTTTQRSSPTTLGMGPLGSAPSSPVMGPPGYRQDCYAQEMTAAQRASLDMEVRRSSLTAQLEVRRKSFAHTLGFTSEEDSGEILAGGPTGKVGRGYGSAAAGDGANGDMWGMAKGWWSSASTKLAATEEVVWKRVNGH